MAAGYADRVLKRDDLRANATRWSRGKTAPTLLTRPFGSGPCRNGYSAATICWIRHWPSRARNEAGFTGLLITADRGAEVRRQAEAANVQVLYKPMKPAALRALLSQWRVQRIAAAE